MIRILLKEGSGIKPAAVQFAMPTGMPVGVKVSVKLAGSLA
jgi:hypothetical protein